MITLRNNTGKVLRGGNNQINFVLPISGTIDVTYEQFMSSIIQNLLNTTPASLVVTTWDTNNKYQPVIRDEGLDAEKVPYDNTESGMSADQVQEAIDELAEGGPASSISFSNTNSSLSAITVQGALEELSTVEEIETEDATPTEILSLAVTANTCNMVQCKIQGKTADGSIKYNSDWVVAYDNTSISNRPVGESFLIGTAPTIGVDFSVAAGALSIKVIGVAATTIGWKIYYRHYVN